MLNRKIIFECVHGSHLFGISTPESDEDYIGVFMPDKEELLGIKTCPNEWSLGKKISEGERNTKGDVDRKFYSVRRYLELAGQGQSTFLEMLFAPKDKVITTSPEWEAILSNKHLFLSRDGISPFIGFAKAQAHRAVMKGEHFNLLKDLIRSMKEVRNNDPCSIYLKNTIISKETKEGQTTFFGHRLRLFYNDHGFIQLEIAGRPYDPGSKIKMLRNSLETLVERYGTRVQNAAAEGFDYKSILHCMRQLGEAEEFLKTGEITLPRPPEEIEFLMSIRRKEFPSKDVDLFDLIEGKIDFLKNTVLPNSPLPPKVDWNRLNELCIKIHLNKFK